MAGLRPGHPRLSCCVVRRLDARDEPGQDEFGLDLALASQLSGLARYCETVCTTLLTGRVLATGTFMSLTSASSYSGNVCNGALAFICTTL
jgi:hypothetical protein